MRGAAFGNARHGYIVTVRRDCYTRGNTLSTPTAPRAARMRMLLHKKPLGMPPALTQRKPGHLFLGVELRYHKDTCIYKHTYIRKTGPAGNAVEGVFMARLSIGIG